MAPRSRTSIQHLETRYWELTTEDTEELTTDYSMPCKATGLQWESQLKPTRELVAPPGTTWRDVQR